MIAFSVASGAEWRNLLKYLNVDGQECLFSPFGQYFRYKKSLFYRSLTRKTLASASTQWVLDRFDVECVVVLGTCAGVSLVHQELDLFQFEKAVQCDVLVEEVTGSVCASEVKLHCFEALSFLKRGKISTMDKPLVLKTKAQQLKDEGIDCDDMESAAVALVCEMNQIPCTVIKGISDFPNGSDDFRHQDEKYRINTEIIMKEICEKVIPILLEGRVIECV